MYINRKNVSISEYYNIKGTTLNQNCWELYKLAEKFWAYSRKKIPLVFWEDSAVLSCFSVNSKDARALVLIQYLPSPQKGVSHCNRKHSLW